MIRRSPRLKLLFVAPYAAVPPRYGGPLRVYNLCLGLSRYLDISQFAQQANRNNLGLHLSPVIQEVVPGYTEYSSRNPVNLSLYALTSLRMNCPPVWQSTVLQVMTPQWLRRQVREADVIHVEHPWQFAWVYRQIGGSKPIVLGSANVETDLYPVGRIAAPRAIARSVATAIERQERFAVTRAAHIFATSIEDSQTLSARYGVPKQKFTIVPNGVDCSHFIPASSQTREQRKQELGLSGRHVVLFAGSMHEPNVEAVRQILSIASRVTDDRIVFLVVGTVGRKFMDLHHPRVMFTGPVESTKVYFEAADVAINPMLSGSGTNLKQLEFMAMGLPTLATPVGARGIDLTAGVEGYVLSVERFPDALYWLLERKDVMHQVGSAARAFVQRHFDWSVVAGIAVDAYEAAAREWSR